MMIILRDMVKSFKALTKDDIIQSYISDNNFRSSNDDDDIGYNLCVFDIRYQNNLEPAQPIKVEFNFLENVSAGIYGYALMLTKEISKHKLKWSTPF